MTTQTAHSDERVLTFTPRSLDQIPADQSAEFFTRMFGPGKGGFLAQFGDWWHRGATNRTAIMCKEDGGMAAYYATTPTQVDVLGERVDTLWWIDLMVDPTYRRRGLQSLMDDRVRTGDGLKLGFPNGMHSKILERHGWAIRSDLHTCLLPLRPTQLPSVRRGKGAKGAGLRAAAAALAVPAAGLRARLARYRPKSARLAPDATAQDLAAVYERARQDDVVTSVRSAEFLQWRYFDAPYRRQLHVYLAGPQDAPTHFLIARRMSYQGQPVTRILDLYGDLTNEAAIRDTIKLAARDAVRAGDVQVTMMATGDAMRTLLRRLGFILRVTVYLCWHDSSRRLTEALRVAPLHLSLADSDNDPPQLIVRD